MESWEVGKTLVRCVGAKEERRSTYLIRKNMELRSAVESRAARLQGVESGQMRLTRRGKWTEEERTVAPLLNGKKEIKKENLCKMVRGITALGGEKKFSPSSARKSPQRWRRGAK